MDPVLRSFIRCDSSDPGEVFSGSLTSKMIPRVSAWSHPHDVMAQ